MLEVDILQANKWYSDLDFMVQHDMHSYNRIMIDLGNGCIDDIADKNKINTNSYTNTETIKFGEPLHQIL